MVTERWKLVDYINSDREELYDLRNDPYELTNLMVGGWQSLRLMPAWQQDLVRDLRRTPPQAAHVRSGRACSPVTLSP